MPSPAQSGLSLASRHFCCAASIIRASTLATSNAYPILLLIAVSLGAFTYPRHSVIRFNFFSQILGIHTAVLPPVLCFLCVADCLVCPERYAAHGHVPFLYLPASDTRRAHSFYVTPFITQPLSPQEDIQTISWPEVVRRIGAIRNSNPLTELSSSSSRPRASEGAKLDAHDIANRIMRQENFLIALFNKELLDLRVPRPNGWPTEEGKGRTLTRSLEWNLQFCLMEYLFDRRGQVRKVFLKSKNRAALIDGYVERNGFLTFLKRVFRLRRRFIFMGILNAIFAPFIVVYLLMYSFFRYFEVRVCTVAVRRF
jgi:hypothetical protein